MSSFSKQLDTLSPAKRQLFDLLVKRRAPTAPPGAARPAAPADALPFALISAEDRAKVPEGVEDAYPLSVVQLGMIYHMLQEGQRSSTIIYHNVSSFHLDMRFDAALFQEAANRVIARHATLRSSFDLTTYSEPLQLVHRAAFLPVQVEDLRGLPPQEQDTALMAFIRRENGRLFDLAAAPLMRICFHRLSAASVWLTLTEPHAISDGWSTHLTLVEILTIYHALLNGEPASAPAALKSSYRDFVQLEREALRSEAQRQFWEQRLSDLPVSQLPRWGQPPPAAHQEYKQHLDVPAEVLGGLQDMARLARVPLKSVLMAACIKALGFVCNQADVTVGLALNGRPETLDGDQIRGLFLNTLPLRCALRPGSWVDLVQQAHQAEIEMLPFRRYPLAALQKKHRDQPLFDLVFQFLHFHSVAESLQSGRLERVNNVIDLSKADFPVMISFTLVPVQPPRLTLMVEYEASQFHAEQISAFCGYIAGVLRAMGADPAARHTDHPFLSPAAQHRLLVAHNATRPAALAPTAALLQHLFEAQAARTPDAIAAVDADTQLTYGELDARANRLARHLRGMGVGPDALVGIAMDRSAALLVGLLGILKAGGAYLPLDPAAPPERSALILADARPQVLLTAAHDGATPVPAGPWATVDLAADWPAIGRQVATAPRPALTPDHLAYVIYTSGSTGTPKGVQITHRAVVNFLGSMRACPGMRASDTLLAVTTLSFDIAALELFLPLTVGARVVILPRDVSADAPRLASSLAAHQATVMQATPATWRMLLLAGTALPRLRALCGGEALPPDLARGLLDSCGEVWNMYGPTETTIWSALAPLTDRDAPLSLGGPIANTALYVLDPAMRLVPLGTPGELYIGGAGLARGYLGRPALTAARFLPHPFSAAPGERLYRTGDLVRYLPDGTLEFLGRADFQVKVRGFRVELGEIEAALAQHPQVREAAVLAHPDPAGTHYLAAYVVLEPDVAGAATSDGAHDIYTALRRSLQQRLPSYMIPATFVGLERMPLTPNGKLNRTALPAPDAAARRSNLSAAFRPPATPAERALAAIWADVLGVEQIGVDDNLFELGGDSILALRIVFRSHQAGVPITLNQLLRHQSIGALTALLDATPLAGAAPPDAPPPATAPPHTSLDMPATPLSQSDLAWILEKYGNDEDA